MSQPLAVIFFIHIVISFGTLRFSSEASIIRYAKIAMKLQNKTVRDVALRCRWMTVCSIFSSLQLAFVFLLYGFPLVLSSDTHDCLDKHLVWFFYLYQASMCIGIHRIDKWSMA